MRHHCSFIELDICLTNRVLNVVGTGFKTTDDYLHL